MLSMSLAPSLPTLLARSFSSLAEPTLREDLHVGSFVPQMDVHEEKDRLVIKMDLPGIKAEDIQITVDSGVLRVRGERSYEKSSDEDDRRIVERRFGSFVRSIKLPESADVEQISASGKDGVLEVVVNKLEAVLPRRIEVAS